MAYGFSTRQAGWPFHVQRASSPVVHGRNRNVGLQMASRRRIKARNRCRFPLRLQTRNAFNRMAVKHFKIAAALVMVLALPFAAPALAQGQETIQNDMARCRGDGPAARITVTDIKPGNGTMRVQLYHATKQDWLAKGRWIYRIQVPARAGSMTFCMPAPQAGSYAIAIRHDANGNGKTDLTVDGGGMSNNPSINIFNLGKPSVDKAAFSIGNEVKPISIRMRYL
jgi:uncharacterized protein (DUF2141 family)